MTISIPVLPTDIAVGATVTFKFDTAKNTSEGGISGRKSFRSQVIRNYMLSIGNGDASEEFQRIVLSLLGQRYPLALRDLMSFTMEDEELDWTAHASTTTAPLRKLFEPATGDLFYYQRVLLLDGTPTFKLNGVALPGGVTATIVYPGIVSLNTVLGNSPLDVLTVSGNYFVPVCIVDDPASNIMRGPDVLFAFESVRFEEILEAELIKLTT